MTTATIMARPHIEVAPVSRRSHIVSVCIVLVLMAVTGIVYFTNIAGYPVNGGDEGTYVSQAWSSLYGQLSPYGFTYDHPPVAWLQIAVPDLILHVLGVGQTAVGGGRYVMGIMALVDVPLIFAIARRLRMRRVFAAVAVAVVLLSPLSVYLLREVYLDTIALPWLLGALLLVLSPSRRLLHYLAAGVCLGMAILSKETTLLLAPGILYALWVSADLRTRRMGMAVFLGTVGLLVLSYPLFAAIHNELLPGQHHVSLWHGVMYQLASRTGTGGTILHGAKHDLLSSWLGHDRWLLYAGIVCLPVTFTVRRLRFLAVAMVVVILPILKPGGYLPAMYIEDLLPFLGLAIAGVADAFWSLASRPVGWFKFPVLSLSAMLLAISLISVVLPWSLALHTVMTTKHNTASQ